MIGAAARSIGVTKEADVWITLFTTAVAAAIGFGAAAVWMSPHIWKATMQPRNG
jgi:hypothetical protein